MTTVYFEEAYIKGVRGYHFDGACEVGVIAESEAEAKEKRREIEGYEGGSIGLESKPLSECSDVVKEQIEARGYSLQL